MHHKIIVKVWADDEEEAENAAKDALEDSVQENNSCGWDYLSDDMEHITEDKLPQFGVKTFEELEKKYTGERKKAIQTTKESIREILQKELSDYIAKDDVPLLLTKHDDEFNAVLEKVLKSKKKPKKLPTDYTGLVNLVLKVMVDTSSRETLAMYYMEKINELERCISSPESLEYTLQCTENHFAEIPRENTNAADDSKAFYFWADRHM